MGLRLHYAQHYDPDWQGGYWNRDQEAWHSLFTDKFKEHGWESSNECNYEVRREDIQAYIEEIQDAPEEYNNYFTDYKNEQVVSDLEMILTSDDDMIHVSWF